MIEDNMREAQATAPLEKIAKLIYTIRGQKVMLSFHLAELYSVEPRVLIQAVKRNHNRFPEDFMLQLTRDEFANLKSQIVISSWGGPRRATPHAFTEQGVAMLSSVLHSQRAILVNVEIMRTFVRLRQILASHANLARRLDELEAKYDTQFKRVFRKYAIGRLFGPKMRPKGHFSSEKPNFKTLSKVVFDAIREKTMNRNENA